MADNTTLNAMTGGDVIAADDIGGVKHQLMKVEYGGADSATQVSLSSGLPVNVLSAPSATGNITTQNLNPNSGTATAASTVSSTTVGVTGAVAIQVTGTYTGALSLQMRLDGTNWITLGAAVLFNVNTGVYSATIASAATGIFWASVPGAVDIRISANAAVTGTATVTIVPLAGEALMPSVLRAGVKGSTTAADVTSTGVGADHQAIDARLFDLSGNGFPLANSTASNYGFPIMAQTGGSNLQKVLSSVQDTDSLNPGNQGAGYNLITVALNMLYNGSTWDRFRSIVNATNSTGGGILSAGLIGQLDDTSPTAITENQFGNIRITDQRALHTDSNIQFTKDASATASGDTAAWTPTSGKKFHLKRFMIGLTADAACATGGDVDIVLRDSTTAIPGTKISLNVPLTAATTTGAYFTPWIELGSGIRSVTANNVLNINLSQALTTGKAFVILAGIEV